MRRATAALLAACALAVLLGGCGRAEADQAGAQRAYRVYYLEEIPDGGQRLAYANLSVPPETGREAWCALMVEAMNTPGREALSSALPEGIALSLTFQGQVVRAEFDGAFDGLSEARKAMTAAALSLSLFEHSENGFVYIYADGRSQPPFYDRPISRQSFITEEEAARYFGA